MKLRWNPVKVLFTCIYLLVGLGIVMTYSTSAVYADYLYQNPQHFLVRQILYALLGSGLMFVTAAVPLQFWKRHALALMLFSIGFLFLVFIPHIGHTAGGAKRWINLGMIKFQPAEFAKIAVCIYLADYLTRKRKMIYEGSLKVFFPPLVLVGITCVLTLLQPDLGSTAFIFLIVASLIFLAGLRMWYVGVAASVVIPIFYMLVVRVPYRLSRLSAYLNPWNDPQGNGFQIIQSFLAFGLGSLKGVGLGQSMQKLFYLPSSYNDFIFSIIAEELGIVGVLAVMALYVTIFLSGLELAKKASDSFQRLLIIALTLMIVLQAIIHMLVTTGLVPTKGLPLPFVSFGGTSLLFNFMALGLIMSAEKHLHRSR
ncbi:MAG: putative lipid II flippase FtsW [Candidatus Omnitrophica bacterium]|nr:putative lipid II flippase FtsW [Candidatus Omnitrophota bacterium]